MQPCIALYRRISRDRDGSQLGVDRQEKLCRQLIAQKEWTGEVVVYTDNDRSATRKNGKLAERPDFDRLCRDIEAGRVAAVTAVDQDRLFREPAEAEAFWSLCERAGVTHVATTDGEVDVASGDGLMVSRIKAAVASEEVRRLSVRTQRKHAELAEHGQSHGGPRLFGVHRDCCTDDAGQVVCERWTLRDDEAGLVQKAVKDLLSDDPPTLTAICREWNERGVTTTRGNAWRTQVLGKMLRSPWLSGQRVYHGEPIGPAVWPAVIDPDEHAKLIEKLSDKTRTTHHGVTARKRWLAGLLVCGRCSYPMRSASTPGRVPAFVCKKSVHPDACGAMAVTEAPLAEHLSAVIIQRLSYSAELSDGLADDDGVIGEVAEQLEAARLRLEELDRARWVDGEITPEQYRKVAPELRQRVDDLEAELRRLTRSSVVENLPSDRDELTREWAKMAMQERHAIAGALIERVEVHPARPGANRFDPERLVVVWRA